ncbi:MAG TPA: hypothetical protein VJS68_01910, partial [Thermoplasmata archaeon]|nr:hypothetical protein [Thermoplasmata archaeon]
MNALTCGKLRVYLEAVKSGKVPDPDAELWTTLHGRGVVAGTPQAPHISPTGEHTLHELTIRAYRADGLPVSA